MCCCWATYTVGTKNNNFEFAKLNLNIKTLLGLKLKNTIVVGIKIIFKLFSDK